MRRISGLGWASLSVIVAGAVAGGLLGQRLMPRSARLSHALRLHAEILETVQEEYVDGASSTVLVSSSIRGLLGTLDPHSRLLLPGAQDRIQEHQRGSYDGLGMTVQAVEGGIRVVSPHEGTPAHRLGIRAGDVIVSIDDRDTRGMLLDDARQLLRGIKGSAVKLTIVRDGYEDPLEFTAVRSAISLHSVPYSFLVAPHVGYVRLVDFKETTACLPIDGPSCARELEQAIEDLVEQGATALLLDVRDNPGGRLEQGFAVAGLFLEQGEVIGSLRGRAKGDVSTYVAQRESRFTDLPLVMITSRHSASASEVVAGAIQDHDRGLIVGERTFGKALVQATVPLQSGYALTITTARYYTPSGRSIQRDYSSMAVEDYVLPSERRACGVSDSSEWRLTDAGRRVYGGDGIAPDHCVEPALPTDAVSSLDARRAFFAFSMLFDAGDRGEGSEIPDAGSRHVRPPGHVTAIDRGFSVDEATYARFRAFVESSGIEIEQEAWKSERAAITRRIEEEVVRQVFGEAEARRRSLAWDPQILRALEVVPDARRLLLDPQGVVAARDDAPRSLPTSDP